MVEDNKVIFIILSMAIALPILSYPLIDYSLLASTNSAFKKIALQDAWASYKQACYNQLPKGYVIAGRYDATTDEIKNYAKNMFNEPEKQLPEVQIIIAAVDMHEQCHKQQVLENRFAKSCVPVNMLLSNEFECYIKQYEFLANASAEASPYIANPFN